MTGVAIPAGLDATLVLVRHGETTFIVEGRFQGQAPAPLTATGRRQAALTGQRLARRASPPVLPIPGRPPVEIVHSPLVRTTETADEIVAAFGEAGATPVTRADDGYREIGQGRWEGLLVGEIEARWSDVLAGWRRDPLSSFAPDGESLPEVATRARAALDRQIASLAADAPGSSVDRPQVLGYRAAQPAPDQPWSIVVAHDGVFKVVLLSLLGLPLGAFWAFPFALGGISILEIRAGRATLRAHNLTDHLAPLLDQEAQVASEQRERSGAL
ncbi:MAG: histidine phosphatase family protein [Chloroflexota bacterium]